MVDATANAPEAPSAKAGEGQGLPADATKTESDAGVAADPAVAADSWITPSFDVLRVEPDGSTVIAGKAEPGTTLDIMNGETVIASTQVGSSGDFAVILDNPLPAGDYQLTLRITGKDGAVRLSEEVATVSIPESADGELLAMVSKPGKASRIIAQPAAPAASEPVETAAATPDANDAGSPAATPDQPAAAGTDTGVAAPAATATEAAAGTETDAATEMAAAAVAPSPGVETPALPEASALLTTSAPQVAGQGDAANAADDAAASADVAPAAEVALATPEAAVEGVPSDATVRVDAVEIEGDRIFIAGSATPGFKVEVLADGVAIGSDTADETGRFIVEATTELSVGDHIINADLMDKSGDNILLRATVPFNRPEGEALAAVSPAEPANAAAQPESAPTQADSAAAAPANNGAAADSNQSAAAKAAGELILPDIASLSKMREDAFEALSQLKTRVSAPDTADEAAVSEALEQAVSKLKSAAMADLPAGSSAESMAIARSMRLQAEAALSVLMPKAEGQAAAGTSASVVDGLAAGDRGRMSELLARAETVLAEPADMAGTAQEGIEGLVAASGQPGEPKTILQAPLASTPGAVIIRRGDTLWQISRRTYGEGVRYTTIYVANRSQIQNPDRIKPGQVFSVPETPLENAEEMHQQLLGERKKP
ncbi:LysM peptidoglycan-binding domain-containing protein [Hoeflea alexandrii]|nr:LysM peptidoglycan-binding domain-containing protein [Hoeflea alexandrii]